MKKISMLLIVGLIFASCKTSSSSAKAVTPVKSTETVQKTSIANPGAIKGAQLKKPSSDLKNISVADSKNVYRSTQKLVPKSQNK